jgi:hypothetical protein
VVVLVLLDFGIGLDLLDLRLFMVFYRRRLRFGLENGIGIGLDDFEIDNFMLLVGYFCRLTIFMQKSRPKFRFSGIFVT